MWCNIRRILVVHSWSDAHSSQTNISSSSEGLLKEAHLSVHGLSDGLTFTPYLYTGSMMTVNIILTFVQQSSRPPAVGCDHPVVCKLFHFIVTWPLSSKFRNITNSLAACWYSSILISFKSLQYLSNFSGKILWRRNNQRIKGTNWKLNRLKQSAARTKLAPELSRILTNNVLLHKIKNHINSYSFGLIFKGWEVAVTLKQYADK